MSNTWAGIKCPWRGEGDEKAGPWNKEGEEGDTEVGNVVTVKERSSLYMSRGRGGGECGLHKSTEDAPFRCPGLPSQPDSKWLVMFTSSLIF